jgi:hypothetical protein
LGFNKDDAIWLNTDSAVFSTESKGYPPAPIYIFNSVCMPECGLKSGADFRIRIVGTDMRGNAQHTNYVPDLERPLHRRILTIVPLFLILAPKVRARRQVPYFRHSQSVNANGRATSFEF